MVDRTQREFSEADIAKIAGTYHALREGEGYADVRGFAARQRTASSPATAMSSHPGRYVGPEDVEADAAHLATLQATLEGQFAGSTRLTQVMRQRLASAIVPDERADV